MNRQQALPISRGSLTSVTCPRSKDQAFLLLSVLPFKFAHHISAPMPARRDMPVSRQGLWGRVSVGAWASPSLRAQLSFPSPQVCVQVTLMVEMGSPCPCPSVKPLPGWVLSRLRK